jgi:hypothetical protein
VTAHPIVPESSGSVIGVRAISQACQPRFAVDGVWHSLEVTTNRPEADPEHGWD